MTATKTAPPPEEEHEPPKPPLGERLTKGLKGQGKSIKGTLSESALFLGNLFSFIIKTIAHVPLVVTRYRKETIRILMEITFGQRILAVAASTVAVVVILSVAVGVLLGSEGLSGLNVISLGPLAGFLSAFGNTREIAPLITGFGLAAQVGSKFTAELGAMRVTEEVDALEVMAVPSLPYLVTTRLIAALFAVIPLYLIALAGAYVATELTVILAAHQGTGTYLHYFHQYLDEKDIIFSVLKVFGFAVLITFIHCFYGYSVSGGPEDVGIAAGRAIRTMVITLALSDLLMTLLFWGTSTPIKVTG